MTAVLDRRPARCDDHRARRKAGCTPCRRYSAWQWRDRTRRLAEGTWEGLCPLDDAAAHLHLLTDTHGWTLTQIAERTGYTRDRLSEIRDGHRTRGILAATRDAILGVPPGPPPSTRYVPAIGSHRRLRALCRHGYTFRAIEALSGTSHDMIKGILSRDRVTADTHARIVDVYRQLAVSPGPSTIGRAKAAAPRPDHPRGWPGPMCWTPETIDDPAAEPDWGDAPAAFRPSRCRAAACPILQLRDRRRRLDHAAVEQCLLGIRTAGQLSTAERIAVVTRLAGQGLDDVAIAARTRWTSQSVDNPGQAVTQFRAGHGLAAGRPRVGWAA